MRKFTFLIGIFSMLLNLTAHSEQYGRVRLPGSGKVEHDGDFVVYNLNFKAHCYANQGQAINSVSDSVSQLASWLDTRAISYDSGSLDYQVGMIQTDRDSSPYLGYDFRDDERDREPNPCYRKYTTIQDVSIRITKVTESNNISTETIQNFYNELYLYIWNLNFIEEGNDSYFEAVVTDISKGIFESTMETLKEMAYGKAVQQATRNLLAILGAGYHGQWFLETANFTNDRYISSREERFASADSAVLPPSLAGPMMPAPTPAVIKLDTLSYSVDGVFEFGFSHDFHNGRP